MGKKRGHGEGSIVKLKDGTWRAAISLGTDATGKRLRRFVRGKTKDEVTRKLTRLQNQKLDGNLIHSGKLTVGELLERWLQDSARLSVAPKTFERYTSLVTKHIKPILGPLKLANVKPMHVQSMLSKLEELKAGAETRRYCFQVLKRAFNVGIAWELALRNPCASIKQPKVVRRPIEPLQVDQTRMLFMAAYGFIDKDIIVGGYRNAGIVVLAVTLGLRQGELFAIQRVDIDLTAGILAVRFSLEELGGKLRLKEPKSKSGKRQIRLPSIAVDAIRKQEEQLKAEGLDDCPILFPDLDGGYMRKSNFAQRIWHPMRKLAGIPKSVVFHDLRHTSASLLLSTGTHPKIVQERLGHSTIRLTMDTYSHLMPGMQEQASGQFDRLLA